MNNPVDGDQFGQPDRRTTTGVNASQTYRTELMGRESEFTLGAQFQNDSIANALTNTVARQFVSSTRADHIRERSLGLYGENTTRWSASVRSVAGLRADNFHFAVDSDNAANSGATSASKVSPKLNLIFGPLAKLSSTPVPATAFTATTRAALRSR